MRKVAKEGEDAEYEWGIKYIKRYIPEKVFNTLRMADVVAIFTELKVQSAKAGLDMGESKALPNS
jgi:hypothetical protein